MDEKVIAELADRSVSSVDQVLAGPAAPQYGAVIGGLAPIDSRLVPAEEA